jgi:tryptophan synthase alpha chain
MNRIRTQLAKDNMLLSVYFSAGYPSLHDTSEIIIELEKNGVGMIEIGLPFSDPLADGSTIQHSSQVALQNGMTTKMLFEQLENIRENVEIPLLIMGYLNPILQYGLQEFCKECATIGIDGLIVPDMPVVMYESEYKVLFEQYGLSPIFLITPQTSESRIRYIDSISNGFIYVVSSDSTTGEIGEFGDRHLGYFERIQQMKLKNPMIIGFGIGNKKTFAQATTFANGAIVGSAFIKHLGQHGKESVASFVALIK